MPLTFVPLLRHGLGYRNVIFKVRGAKREAWLLPSAQGGRERAGHFSDSVPCTNSGGAAQTFENKMKRPGSRMNLGSISGKCPNKRIVRPWCILPRDSVESHYLVV